GRRPGAGRSRPAAASVRGLTRKSLLMINQAATFPLRCAIVKSPIVHIMKGRLRPLEKSQGFVSKQRDVFLRSFPAARLRACRFLRSPELFPAPHRCALAISEIASRAGRAEEMMYEVFLCSLPPLAIRSRIRNLR